MLQAFRYGESDSQMADLYLPAGTGARPVVCLLHGGFWRMPYGRDEMAAIAADLAASGYAVWNIEYRRVGASGGGWPGTLEDVAAAIDHLALLPSGETHLDLRRVAVVGHSAGGHLALCAGARRAEGRARPFAPSRVVPVAVCGLAAVTDLDKAFALDSGNGAVSSLLGGSPGEFPARYAQASPVRLLPLGVRQLLAVPAELARDYAQAARRAGDRVDYMELAGMGHMASLDPSSPAHAALRNWLSGALALAQA
jgi:acetyl esterase/lipase